MTNKNKKVRVLYVHRLGLGAKKDIEIIQSLPNVEKIVLADFHFRVGSDEENRAYLENLSEKHINYYTRNGKDPKHFVDKSCDELINEYLPQVDAVYIAGSRFDPSPKHCMDQPKKSLADIRREEFEIKLIQKASERGIPMLAICAGSWRLANAFGGKTIALSEEHTKKHLKENMRLMSDYITIKSGTMLHGIHTAAQANKSIVQKTTVDAGKSKIVAEKNLVSSNEKNENFNDQELYVNSTHWRVTKFPEHQPFTEFGHRFETSAQDPDTKTLEAFESKYGTPIIGVQFHPEYSIPLFIEKDGSYCIVQDYKTHRSILESWIESGQSYRHKQELQSEIKNHLSQDDQPKKEQTNGTSQPLMQIQSSFKRIQDSLCVLQKLANGVEQTYRHKQELQNEIKNHFSREDQPEKEKDNNTDQPLIQIQASVDRIQDSLCMLQKLANGAEQAYRNKQILQNEIKNNFSQDDQHKTKQNDDTNLILMQIQSSVNCIQDSLCLLQKIASEVDMRPSYSHKPSF